MYSNSAYNIYPFSRVHNCLYILTYGKKGSKKKRDRMRAEVMRKKNNNTRSRNVKVYSHFLDKLTDKLSQSGGDSEGGDGDDKGGSSGELGYLNGKNFTNKDVTKHDLGKTAKGVNAEMLNKWIDATAPKNSKMRGLGETYMKAAKESGLDPRYLVAHSAVETGWGTSNLSGGGDKDKGNWFGIGAFDNNPNNGFNYGQGIIGGAKWIRKNFYDKGQKTLGTMRHNGGKHEYATDPNWDKTIAGIMSGSDKFLSKGGKGGGYSSTYDNVMSNPILTTTLNTQEQEDKNLDFNIEVPKGATPKETGKAIGRRLKQLVESNF